MIATRPYHWYCLLGAIILEVAGSTVMKMSQGWTFQYGEICGLALMWLAIGLSYYLLARATLGVPVGVAFAFWEGLGLALVTVSSIFVLQESFGFKRFLGICLVLLGAWFVHLGTGHGNNKKR